MAIDFSQVKALSIPEGNVISISSGGVVIWSSGPRLTSITLSGYNTSLNINSNFIYGGTVTANYSDGTTADVTLDTTFSGYNMATAGTQTVTASYTENGITKTATYTLTIVSTTWHTLWEGSESLSTATAKTLATLSSLSGSVRVRITWSASMSGGSSMTNTYYDDNVNTSTQPASPYEITFDADTYPGYYDMLGVRRSNSSNQGMIISLKWIPSLKQFRLNGSSMGGGTGGVSVTLTITKIEQYY